ncbi:MAG: pyrroloquinoline quinone biosynthesis protein PqqB, partial [Geminicoccaceae bacterium]
DLRGQLLADRVLHPGSLRDTPIRAVLLTNGDIDHIAGLLTLREKQTFRLLATADIHAVLDANPIFTALDAELVVREVIALNTPFALTDGLQAELFAVPGKVPLFLEGEQVDTELEGEQTVAVEICQDDHRLIYAPGCARLNHALRARLEGADAVFFDGTLYRDDEMITAGLGHKTGKRMGHMSIDGADGSLALLRNIPIGRRIYIHINNSNPIWRDGPERRTVESAGFEIGFDGMEIEL